VPKNFSEFIPDESLKAHTFALDYAEKIYIKHLNDVHCDECLKRFG
jgi:hypothetical protein